MQYVAREFFIAQEGTINNIMIKTAKNCNRLLREMRKVFIPGHLQNLSERKTEQHYQDLRLSVFSICLDSLQRLLQA